MPVFTSDELRFRLCPVFTRLGVSPDDALIVVDHLVEAELCGVASHGLIRVPQYVEMLRAGQVDPRAKLAERRSSAATAVLSGANGFGQVMARGAMEVAIARAVQYGVGAATLVDCSHTGRLASYALQAAARGMIGLVMVNAGGHGQWVAPFGGIAGRLSTNPFSIAAPGGSGAPLVIDAATSIAPEGRIRAHLLEGKPVPTGWLVDAQGNPTTNPADLYGPPRGAILPFGGHKGFGLALMVELLAGALSGAGCCHDPDAPLAGKTDGVFLLAIDVAAFCPCDEFARQVDALAAHIRSSPPAAGHEHVVLPGEPEAATRQKNLAKGLTVPPATWGLIEPLLKTES